MKRIFLLLGTFVLGAQTIDVKTTVTATVGNLTCLLSPIDPITFNVDCKDGTKQVLQGMFSFPTAPGSFVYSVQSGPNTITWLLTKGNPIPDQWQVAVTDGTTEKMKSGLF